MSIARHHAEWLSLLEISGPFLSMPVLLDAFPQGLDAHDANVFRDLKQAYAEWLIDQRNPAIHTAWVRFVLNRVLELPEEVIAIGQAIPSALKATIAEHGETLRPDIVIVDAAPTPGPSPVEKAATGEGRRMLIQVYPPSQDLERPISERRWKASPATRMMELLHACNVRLGLVTNGERWLLVDAPRNETTGFISWYAEYWQEEPITLRAFRSLLSAYRFFSVGADETLEALLAESATDQQEVTDQLGYQVRRAVEVLIQAIDRADQDRGRTLLAGLDEKELYEAALTVMMRLVFLFSAEERGLLLLGDPLYDQSYAVSTLSAQLRETADLVGEEVLERRFDAWCRLLATFRVVHDGVQHPDLRLPAYGGSLFNPDRYPFLEGRATPTPALPRSRPSTVAEKSTAAAQDARTGEGAEQPLPINNRVVLHLLEALQILQVKTVGGGGPLEARRLSFRALDIEQIGTVYQGLLDHTAVRATEPVLGLSGTKDREPEVPLSALEADRAKNDRALIEFLIEQTGRSEAALKRALLVTHYSSQLQAACGNDEALLNRILPFAGLIRLDDFEQPMVILPGSVYVTAGTERRSTGTHYTPRSLTEPIVQRTLEPLVYVGPAEGLPRDQWRLRGPAEILALKICDMAMGSASFNVQADRYLAELLVEAWELRIADFGLPITVEGEPVIQNPKSEIENQLVPTDPDDRLVLARRLIAERCLYGVDKNPMAVEIAKLSMWLVTMAKDRPFTFLDHAFKCGDSLVGADEEMFERWAHGLQDAREMTLFDETLRDELNKARSKRRELESFVVNELRDAERKAALLAEAEAAIARVKLGCDLIIGTRLLNVKPKEKEARLNTLLIEYMAQTHVTSPYAHEALAAARNVRAFHWPFEFPEVFERGGFDAFLGNPPFLGGLRISTMLGDFYLRYLRDAYPSSTGTADLCAFFFLRAFDRLRINGALGLIATNTIAQGDTRQTGLDSIAKRAGTIYMATSSMPWPGVAAVHVSVVHILKGIHKGPKLLDGKDVQEISSLLDTASVLSGPKVLEQNAGKSYIGSFVLGIGFVLESEAARQLINKSPKNRDVLFPYLVGEDLNTRPDQSPSRWVINFFDWPLERAEQYPDCLDIVRRLVKPHRDKVNRARNRERWWIYAENRPGLYSAIASLKRVMVLTIVSRTVAFAFTPSDWVFSHRVVVFPFESNEQFALLQSSLHYFWAWKYSSTMKSDLNYSPTDCFQTFPFPLDMGNLETVGGEYHEHRRQIMLARQEGLTTTYNRFHDADERSADIARLRDLHVEMDRAVAAAYGWDDLALGHGFHETPQGVRFTLSESARREVLGRLLELNHQRYEEEVAAGLHEKGGKKKANGEKVKSKGRKKKTSSGGEEGGSQMGLL
jgi:hypothetical protein